jgi:hypothetical protein
MAAPRPGDMKITLWGSPASGKTTFLAAMSIAANQTVRSPAGGRWTMWPNDRLSMTFMAEECDRLTRDKLFPDPTIGINRVLSWTIRGVEPGEPPGRLSFRKRPPMEVRFSLRVPDVSGELFGRTAESEAGGAGKVDPQRRIELMDMLVKSDAIVFLFDPVAENEDRQAFQYLNGMLTELMFHVQATGGAVGSHLPHRIAVCVTKFDHPSVYEAALAADLVTQDGQDQPCVRAGRDAERFFDHLCRRIGGSAMNVSNALKGSFAEDRRLFFVTSSVGFRPGPVPAAGFDREDPFMVNRIGGRPVIRDMIRPINVLEPVIELERLMRAVPRP